MQPTARSGRGSQARKALMATAIDCFAHYGFQATSIDRIAKAAGVTKGAIYYHFTDKEELLFEAVKNHVGQFERRVLNDMTPITDAATALRSLTTVCFEHATKSTHRRLIVTLMVESLDSNPTLATQFRDMMQRFREFLCRIVQAGQEHGDFRSTVKPTVAAEVFAGAVMGAEIQYYQNPEEFDLSATLDACVEQFIAWLTPPQGQAMTRRRHEKAKEEQ